MASICYEKLGDLNKSADYAAKASSLDGKNGFLAYRAAFLYAACQNSDQALCFFGKATLIDFNTNSKYPHIRMQAMNELKALLNKQQYN